MLEGGEPGRKGEGRELVADAATIAAATMGEEGVYYWRGEKSRFGECARNLSRVMVVGKNNSNSLKEEKEGDLM